MTQRLIFEVAAPAGAATSEETLLNAIIDLGSLGIEPAHIDRRRVGFWMQERLADDRQGYGRGSVRSGQPQGLPLAAQVELKADAPDRAILTWLAPPRSTWPRRFVLDMAEPSAGRPLPFPQVQIWPDAHDRVWVTHDGRKLLGYCYSAQYPKPFFYPVIGPSGRPLTRLGHPRDFDGGHDHHRSLWIEHENVNDVCFETEHLHFFAGSDSPLVGIGRIAQRKFLKQEDGPVYARLEMELDWISHSGEALLSEIRRVRIYPLAGREQLIDFDLTFRPRVERVTFGRSTFGILAARVAHSLEVTRAGGRVCTARGGLNEAELHRRPAEWCDYAGPITPDETNGLAIFDHPDNIHHPAIWHVRDDGWMCVAPFAREAVTLRGDESLQLRYRVFAHAGDDTARIASQYADFAYPPAVTRRALQR